MLEKHQQVSWDTARPHFQHIPVSNYIITILQIIGVGNKFVDQILEWVDDRVEQAQQYMLRLNMR
jgi:hypothetical protein